MSVRGKAVIENMYSENLQFVAHEARTASRFKSKFVKFARLVPFLACLAEHELTELEQVVIEKRFPKDSIVLFEEDTCKYLYIVYAGKVKAVKTSMDGREHILAVHKRGDFFGEIGILDGKTTPATVIAMEESEIGLIGKEAFERYLLSNPKVLREIVSTLCLMLREAWLKVKVLSHTDAESRVRAVLELIAMQHGVQDTRGTIIPLNLTHKDIGHFSSLSRETVTRQLLKFTEGEEIEILQNKHILLKQAFIENAQNL